MARTRDFTTRVSKIQPLLKGMTLAELNAVSGLIKDEWRRQQSTLAREFAYGDAVQFTDRRGNVVRGTVEKINVKSVSVKAGFTTWRVAPSLLTHAEG